MKKLFSLFFALSITLSACGTASTQPTLPTKTRTPTVTLTATQTPIATITPLPTIPTITPTFDVSSIVTVTPVEKAECPKEDQTQNADSFSSEVNLNNTELAEKILDLLNQGVPKSKLVRGFANFPTEEKDLTNDGVLEFIVQIGNGFGIYKCNMSKYELALSMVDDFRVDLKHIISTQDMNLDGMPEVVASISACSGYGCLAIRIYEWDGSEFQSLLRVPIYDSSTGNIIEISNSAGIDAPKSVEIADIDGDGTLELVITGGYSPQELPTARYETHIYAWDGLAFVPKNKNFSEPDYLFQAIQDADTAVLDGDYETGLKLYQRGIENRELEWWSTERYKYEQSVIDAKLDKELTPSAQPIEDSAEYPSLAAYAYYRIMLLQLMQGQEAEAASTYKTLQDTFGSNQYAAPYIEMAAMFLEGYQPTQRMYDGCAAAIQYAVEHPEILIPLGSDYHGWQSHIYVPADVCPFR